MEYEGGWAKSLEIFVKETLVQPPGRPRGVIGPLPPTAFANYSYPAYELKFYKKSLEFYSQWGLIPRPLRRLELVNTHEKW
jgi:hypothetical protein